MSMQIKDEILDPIRAVFANQGFNTLKGEYDGLNGALTMTWLNPAASLTETFIYAGASVPDFKLLLMDTTSLLVSRYNATYGFPTEREIFLDEVVE